MRNTILTGAAAGAFLVGAAGAALAQPHSASAADPTPTPTAAVTTSPTTSPALTPLATSGTSTPGFSGAEHGPGLDTDDLAAAAGALGMTEADLEAELEAGETAAAIAEARGVDVQKVIDAVVASDTAEIEAAVAAGTMTQAQADERLANLTQHVTDEVNGTGGGHGGRGHGRGISSDDIADAAAALGMTESELSGELAAGKSVADVAAARGIDLQVVIDAMVAADTAEIEAAVAAGTMTRAQADERLANLTQHVTDEVNGTGGGHGGRGHGPRGGFDGDDATASPTTETGTGA